MKKIVSCVLACCMLAALTACGPVDEPAIPTAAPTPSSVEDKEETALFTPRTYIGTARGREGDVSVEVTFGTDTIENVKLKGHSDTPVIFNAAFEVISEDITACQSLNVEAVSGATISSNAILRGVKDCVEQAGGDVDALMAEIPKTGVEENLSADLVVVGGGGAGLSAALEAAGTGAKVILVEAQGMTGGSTGLSTGMLIAAATEEEKQAQGALTVEEMVEALEVYGSEYYDAKVSRSFLEASRKNQDWVMALGREAGYELGITYESCFLPFEPGKPAEEWETANYTVVMAETQSYIDTQVDGPLGFWITEGLYKAALEAGVEIYLNTRAEEILSASGAVTGIRAVNRRDGSTYTISAKSVVLACGGFGANQEMIEAYNNSAGPYLGAAANDGFGILAAEGLGAKLRFATVPFFEEYPEIYNSIGGVIINDQMQVLNEADQPIAGLYSAGEMACVTVMDPPHLFSGHNNAWGIYSGRTAGGEAARYALS